MQNMMQHRRQLNAVEFARTYFIQLEAPQQTVQMNLEGTRRRPGEHTTYNIIPQYIVSRGETVAPISNHVIPGDISACSMLVQVADHRDNVNMRI